MEEVHNTVQKAMNKLSQRKRNARRQSRKKEDLQIVVKRREEKGKGERER